MKIFNTFLFIFISLIFISDACHKDDMKVIRNDNAKQLTHSLNKESCQNPAFSPDGNYLVFTRFIGGYNSEKSEIIKIDINGENETVIVPSDNYANVNVPFGCWAGSKICFSSDRAGASDEIWTVNDDGTNLIQITSHDEATEIYYIEPVFNPQNNKQIIFEYVTGENDKKAKHQIAFLNVLTSEIKLLTDGTFDDRLPSWSNNKSEILFQRKAYGQENGWKVYTANIDTLSRELHNIKVVLNENIDQTDCSWYFDDNFILTSAYFDNSEMPNIFLLPVNGKNPIRISNTETNEDGAPASSPDGKKIAFESHFGEDETEPSEIWIIDR